MAKRKAPLRRFTTREVFVIREALQGQMDSTCKMITQMEKDGKHPMFTCGFVQREHKDLIKLIESNARKTRKFK